MKISLTLLLVLILGLLCLGCQYLQIPSQPPTEAPTQAPTSPSTEPPTEPPTEPSTEPPTEPVPTDPPALETVELPTLYRPECQEYISLFRREDRTGWMCYIPKGDTMELLSWNNRVAQVRYNGLIGYVAGQYIRPADDSFYDDCLELISLRNDYSYTDMLRDLRILADTYPESARIRVMGYSEQGRILPVLLLGDPQAKYQVLVQGSMHAREYFNTNLLMALSEYWLSRGMAGLEDVCFHIVPMVNPDGVVLCQSGVLTATQEPIYWEDHIRGRTTLTGSLYVNDWKANALGIDLNRNFPAGWEAIKVPITPSSERYKGTQPLDAKEARALADYTLAQHWDVTLSYHSTGCVLYYEFGTNQANKLSKDLALAVSAVTGYTLEPSYTVEGGGYKDWALDTLGIPSLTIETGCSYTPLAQREVWSIFTRNLQVFSTVAQWVKQR